MMLSQPHQLIRPCEKSEHFAFPSPSPPLFYLHPKRGRKAALALCTHAISARRKKQMIFGSMLIFGAVGFSRPKRPLTQNLDEEEDRAGL